MSTLRIRATPGLSAAAAVVITCVSLRAQSPADDPVVGESVSTSMGLDVPTQYFFRGLLQEADELIVQPWWQTTFGLAAPDADTNFDLSLGWWSSLHADTSTSPRNEIWYESDFWVGLSTTIADRWGVGVTYTNYASPNRSFDTSQELVFNVSFDDSDLWGDAFAGLSPYALLAVETNRGQGQEAIYLELGVGPTFDLGDGASLTTSATLGLGPDNYYVDNTGDDGLFGYFDIGADVSIPLDVVPPRFGSWSFSAGVHALFLGDEAQLSNNGDGFDLVGTIGMSIGW